MPIRNAKRANSELLSLGQLQQVNLSPYIWQASFPIGNSDAAPHTDREAIAGINSRIVGGSINSGGDLGRVGNTGITTNRLGDAVPGNTMVDMSYLLNENIWDSYFLSTIIGSVNLSTPLPNSRIRYNENAYSAPTGDLKDFDNAAAYLENLGALNINSTSVEAWKALLTAFRDLKLGDNPDNTLPIARTLDPIGDSIMFTELAQNQDDIGSVSSGKDYSKLMNGFRYLTDGMIQTLSNVSWMRYGLEVHFYRYLISSTAVWWPLRVRA